MQVTVNGQPIDYTLQGERLLGEVVASVEKWLNDARLVVTSLRLGDRELASEQEPAWARLPLDGIARLDITASPLDELEREQVALMASYLEQLEAGLDGRQGLVPDTLSAVADFAATVRRGLALSPGSPADRALGELEKLLVGSTADTVRAWPGGIRDRAMGAVASLRDAVRVRHLEIEQPAHALRAVADDVCASSRDLSEVSLMLQTGQDEKAMATVGRFSDLLQSVLRAVARLRVSTRELIIKGRSLAEFVADFNGVLRQAVEALTARDTVLLGDLFEYEVAPRLASLSEFLRGPEAPHR